MSKRSDQKARSQTSIPRYAKTKKNHEGVILIDPSSHLGSIRYVES
jgi:hypothetical protein